MLQPFADAVKLFTKAKVEIKRGNGVIYTYSPVVLLICSIIVWRLIPIKEEITNVKFILLLIILCGAGSVYGHLCAG